MLRKTSCAVMVWVMVAGLTSAGEARAPAHPHVLFDAKMLPEMRRRAASGPARLAMQELARRVEGHLAAETLEPGRFSDPLVELAFAWQMTGDEACALP